MEAHSENATQAAGPPRGKRTRRVLRPGLSHGVPTATTVEAHAAHASRFSPLPEAACVVEGLTHVFPSAERLATAELFPPVTPRTRATALSSLAAAVVADPTIFNPRESLDDSIAALRSLSGIGEWTAQYIAMRELREPDAFPAADIGLMRALADADGNRPTPRELLARAESWRPWRAYAALHLWASEGAINSGATAESAGLRRN